MSQHATFTHSGDAAAHSGHSRIFQQAMADSVRLQTGGGGGPAPTDSCTCPTSSPPSSTPPSSGGTSTFHSAHDTPHTSKTSSDDGKEDKQKGWRWGPARMENGDEGGHV